MGDGIPPTIRVHRNLPYGRGANNKLDLFVPKDMHSSTPLIIWIHGGGWRQGNKADFPAISMVDKGYAVASINYRLVDEAIFPAQIDDCKTAVSWLHANAKKYNLDSDRFGAWGFSSGGHLAALLGTTSGMEGVDDRKMKHLTAATRVQAVCAWAAPIDLEKFAASPTSQEYTNQLVTGLLGGAVDQKRDLARRANPTNYISRTTPPFLLMHGSEDQVVQIEQSQLFAQALTSQGSRSRTPVEFITLDGLGHGIFSQSADLRQVERFFDKTLRGIDSPEQGKGAADVRLVATYNLTVGTHNAGPLNFYSNGRLIEPDGIHTWTLKEDSTLIICSYDPRPGTGVWLDVCRLSSDGKAYTGFNQNKLPINGRLIGNNSLRDLPVHHPLMDTVQPDHRGDLVKHLPLTVALSRATAARWTEVEGGYTIANPGPSVLERKDAISQFTALITKEIGSTAGLTFTENSININKALAKKIVDKFIELQGNVPGAEAVNFNKKFSGAHGPFAQANFERTAIDAELLANLAKKFPGFGEPHVKMDRFDVKLVFNDQVHADRFSDILAEARNKMKIDSGTFGFYVPKDQKSVNIKLVDLNSLSEKEMATFLSSAIESITRRVPPKNQRGKLGANFPDFIRDLQASILELEQTYGEPKNVQPDVQAGDDLASPRFVTGLGNKKLVKI